VNHLPLAATDITAFHVVGALLALWALVVSALGVTRPDFPGKGAGQKVVMAISAVLVAGAIGTAIGTAKDAPKEHAATAAATKTGGGGTTQPQGTVKTLLLSSDPSGQLKFDKTSLQTSPGNVRITLSNPSPVPHNISLEGPGGVSAQGPTVPNGGSSQVSATLKAGTYTFYCSVPGHRQAGMQGTLTVK
jgi:plastocyanin